jgi:hypothetical protein
MEAAVRWYVDQGLVLRPLPRINGEHREGPEHRAEPTGSLFEPPSGREREPRP